MPFALDSALRRLGLGLAAAAAALGVTVVGAATASASVATNFRYAIDSTPNFSNISQTAQRNRYVILQAWQTERMRQLKAANPGIRVLVYKNLSASIADSSGGRHSTGVSWQEANSEHPEWFLQNTSGQRFTFWSYHYLWAMDVGSPSYQRRWADNVIAELEADGWDGVFLDDVNTTMKYHYNVSQIAKYPNDSSWQQATASALAHIGPRVRQAGKLAIPNIGSWGEYSSVGRGWLDHVDGAMDEMFVKWGQSAGSGYAWDGHWERQLGSLRYAQQQGKEFLAVTHSANGDTAAARYGWATVLLGAAGKASFALHGDYTNENWFDFYAQSIGQPTGPAAKLDSGVWRRNFGGGVVAVNPTDATRTVSLGGTYSGQGHTDVTSVQLQPKTAVILNASTTTGGETGDGSEAPRDNGKGQIKPGKKTVKGGAVVATGRVIGPEHVRSATGSRVRIVLRRAGRVQRRARAQLRTASRFVGRVRVCRPGRYRVIAVDPRTGQRASWPGRVRVRRGQLRC